MKDLLENAMVISRKKDQNSEAICIDPFDRGQFLVVVRRPSTSSDRCEPARITWKGNEGATIGDAKRFARALLKAAEEAEMMHDHCGRMISRHKAHDGPLKPQKGRSPLVAGFH